MNFTGLNLTAPAQAGLCYQNHALDLSCVYREVCNQTSASFQAWGLGLLIASVFVELAMPNLLKWLSGPLERLRASKPGLAFIPSLATYEARLVVLWWLKDRILWGLVILTAYQLFL